MSTQIGRSPENQTLNVKGVPAQVPLRLIIGEVEIGASLWRVLLAARDESSFKVLDGVLVTKRGHEA
jgi:hypothetical protein